VGTKLAKGLFVDIEGMHWRIPFTMKNIFITFVNCKYIVMGKNVNILYLVELIWLVQKFEGYKSYSIFPFI
jgi:hypothetical protein